MTLPLPMSPRITGATAAQIESVYRVMRLLAEDDRDRPSRRDHVLVCAGCRRERAAAGSVQYDTVTLCNGCATDYEVLRIGGQVRNAAEYLARGGRAIAS